jgi:RNA polymerase sigma factor (sigma-70 family)
MTTPSVALKARKQDEPSVGVSDEQLVAACLQGDEGAWAALVDRYRNLVYSIPVKYRMPPQDAADVFQAVWTELVAELPRLRNVGSLRSWLITVAGHKCYQWKRQQNSQAAGAEPTYEPADTQALYPEWRQQVDREQMLRDALLDLPPRCREMMHLLFYHQPPLPYKEVAERLGLAEGSIGFIRGRCLKKLRAVLQDKGF